jgi:DNA-directed RNA polymerase beta' subunit
MSVCKVEDPVPIVNGQFKKGGLYDPAMGQAMDTQTPCSTCGHPAPVCPGHFGHLVRHGIRLLRATFDILRASCQTNAFCRSSPNRCERQSFCDSSRAFGLASLTSRGLARSRRRVPAQHVAFRYHIGWINVVLKVLNCVCFHCSRLRLSPVRSPYVSALRRFVHTSHSWLGSLLSSSQTDRCIVAAQYVVLCCNMLHSMLHCNARRSFTPHCHCRPIIGSSPHRRSSQIPRHG